MALIFQRSQRPLETANANLTNGFILSLRIQIYHPSVWVHAAKPNFETFLRSLVGRRMDTRAAECRLMPP